MTIERTKADSIRERLRHAGIDVDALGLDATGTLARAVDVEMPPDLRQLPVLGHDQLRLRTTLGRGGMGVVRLGDQLALGREVAVKLAATPGPRDASGGTARHLAAVALVEEARITGALEHPNIVPIHALGRTADGDALLVMKRIDGESWAELLARRPSLGHELERHLEILIEACRAVHFAHRRGVVHRDLKPANVMVGPFGEVYVLDWGIALCFGDAEIPGARHARDVTSIAGTPSFMAPEMIIPGEPIDPRTDVYLLGGVLHVVLTGRPPRDGASLAHVLEAAYESAPPVLADDVPAELAAICARALARDPADRFGSAEELRLALVGYLRYAGARVLIVEAQRLLATLERAVAEKRADATADLEVARAFSACRFGFEQSLRAWSDSPEARTGLRAALIAMARWELHRRHADAARVLVIEIGDAPRDVAADLEALDREEQKAAEERAALEAKVRAHDPRFGVRGRTLVAIAIAVGWSVFAAGQGAALRGGVHAPTARDLALAYALLAVVFAAVGLWVRTRGSVLNSRYFAAGAASMAVISWGWVAFSPPIYIGIALAHLVFAFGLFVVALFVERRLFLGALCAASGAPLAYAFPLFCFETNVATTLAVLAVIGSALRNEQRP